MSFRCCVIIYLKTAVLHHVHPMSIAMFLKWHPTYVSTRTNTWRMCIINFIIEEYYDYHIKQNKNLTKVELDQETVAHIKVKFGSPLVKAWKNAKQITKKILYTSQAANLFTYHLGNFQSHYIETLWIFPDEFWC